MGALKPHLFALGDAIHRNLIDTKRCQSVVISGESGSGKTETTKYLLSYFCHVCGTSSTEKIPDQIMAANVIMEAFGNAKTVRNDNSSRFGKFIRLCMQFPQGSDYPTISGAFLEDYLLEQSRIILPSKLERSYHVFYQYLAASVADKNQRYYKLHYARRPETYRYLSGSGCYTVEGLDEIDLFDKLITAFGQINVGPELFEGILDTLSAVLWFGNIDFDNSAGEDVEIDDNSVDVIEILLNLLGVELDAFEELLLVRKNTIRGELFRTPFKITEAIENRDAMAKALYSNLFGWITEKIRECTNPSDTGSDYYVGILDIFGFECMKVNSFEQLCINYANEKLHMFFNHYIFNIEQDLYRHENISVDHISFSDNSACLEVLERGSQCVLRILAEECRFPDGTDESYVWKQHSILEKYSHYIKGNDRRYWGESFAIKHYAGEVTYTVKGFLDKNRDAQQDGFFLLLSESKKEFSQEIAEAFFNSQAQLIGMGKRMGRGGTLRATGGATIGGSHRQSVGERFRNQLKSLVQVLDSTNSWYIRCLKPNEEKAPFKYDRSLILNQLRYLGMMDIIRIKREGFPVHVSPIDFLEYYWYLAKDKRMLQDGTPTDEIIENIMKSLNVSPYEWQMGRTQIFMKGNVAELLVDQKSKLLIRNIVTIQKHIRGFTKRMRYYRIRSAVIKLQYFARKLIGDAQHRRRERAIIVLQSFARMILAKNRVNKLKKELLEMELKQNEMIAETNANETKGGIANRCLQRELSVNNQFEPVAGEEFVVKSKSLASNLEESIQPIFGDPFTGAGDGQREENSLDDLMAELDDLSLGMFEPMPQARTAPVAKPRSKALTRQPSNLSKSIEDLFQATSVEEAKKASTGADHGYTQAADLESMLAEMELHLSTKEIPDEFEDLDESELSPNRTTSNRSDSSVRRSMQRNTSFMNKDSKPLTGTLAGTLQEKIKRKNSSLLIRPEDLEIPDISNLIKETEAPQPSTSKTTSLRKPDEFISKQSLDSGIGSSIDTINLAATTQPSTLSEVSEVEKSAVEPPRPVFVPKDKENLTYSLVEYAENHFVDIEYSDHSKSLLSKAFGKKQKVKNKIIPRECLFDFSPDPYVPRPFHNLDSEDLIEKACQIYKELYKLLYSDIDKIVIQNVVGTLISSPALRDEVIAYLIRFSRRTSSDCFDKPLEPQHRNNAWHLLSAVLGVVMPSKGFVKYVKKYFTDLQKDCYGVEGVIDDATLKRSSHYLKHLNRVKIGERKCPPSLLELKAAIKYSGIPISLLTADSELSGSGISPWDTTVDVLKKMANVYELKNTQGWALFETSFQMGDVYVKAQTCLADYLYLWEL